MTEYAVKTPPQHGTWQEFLDVWRAADECDAFDQAWNSIDDWHDKNNALIGHCETIGRDPSEIKRTAHVAWNAGDDPSKLADNAAELAAVGVDQVIFSMRGPYPANEVEPLGAELASR